MCFYIQSGKNARVKIAKENIRCYKIFSDSYKESYGGELITMFASKFRGFRYEAGETYFEDSLDKPFKNPYMLSEAFRIEVGLHSISTLREAKLRENDIYGDSGEIIVRCIIPKGSRYYYNEGRREYVSDTLKIGTGAIN